MPQEKNLVKRGQFYCIYDSGSKNFVLEDRTRRGLPIVENSMDTEIGLRTDIGRVYDANGRGHVMPIRWYFPKETYTLEQVCKFGDNLDNRYKDIMEDTCPDY
ncbi:MAG TPA: hypothetical protein VH481_05135 [Nitrososphaeraceae archaeon]|jgi:hypothetical protein